MQTPTLSEKIEKLPEIAGVYIMKNADGEIIYIGKAKSLKNRVRQYFTNSKKLPKVEMMVRNIADFDYIMVNSEKEALIMECNLIKKHRPKYNILLKDDKYFPYIKITTSEAYPRAEVVRGIEKDNNKYFGPFTSAYMTRELLETFSLRSCKKNIELAQKRKERPCLNYQIGRCPAPCANKIGREEYSELVKNVCEFLGGSFEELAERLKMKMEQYAEELEFEKCAKLRDQIRSVEAMAAKQNAQNKRLEDMVVFGISMQEGDCSIAILYLEDGKVVDILRTDATYNDESSAEILTYVLMQHYYDDDLVLPSIILLPEEPEELDDLQELLRQKRGKKVEIKVPKKGENKRLIEIANKNAFEALNRRLVKRSAEYARTEGATIALSDALHLEETANRLECFDISNTQGTDSVGSMVVFKGGKPSKKDYRRFKIKTVEGSDDFASMAEVLERRLLRSLNNDKGFEEFPDLIVVDGGKGQLGYAYDVLCSLGLEHIPLISLAKRLEEVYVPGVSEPIVLRENSHELNLLIRLRDEAHRFAITYHRGVRQSRTVISELEGISGIGEKRRTVLLSHFKTYDDLKNASFEELSTLPGMDKKSAQAVYEHFANNKE